MTQTVNTSTSSQDGQPLLPEKAEAPKVPVLSLDEGYAYFEGHIVPMSEAKVSIATHALNYGTACFEGMRGYWNAQHGQLYILKLREHYERMANSWNILRPSTAAPSPWTNIPMTSCTGKPPCSPATPMQQLNNCWRLWQSLYLPAWYPNRMDSSGFTKHSWYVIPTAT